jgi:putative MFS transporter
MLGLIGIPATAYVARFTVPYGDWGWRAVFIWGSLAIFFPLFARRLEESPRWLERRGRIAEAETVLARIEREAPVDPSYVASPADGDHAESLGPKGLVRSGSIGRVLLLVCVWFAQTLSFYGFNSWVPTLLAAQGFSIARTLEQTSAIAIGAVPGAWIASVIAERWERKHIIATVATLLACLVLIYSLSLNPLSIVIFGFLVAMTQQTFSASLYAYTAECFPTNARNSGAGVTYGVGRLGNTIGPLIVAFLFGTYGYRSVFVYIAVCWLIVATLIAAFGPRMSAKSLS